jgi:hypothetical protein
MLQESPTNYEPSIRSEPVVILYNTTDPLSLASSRVPDAAMETFKKKNNKLYKFYKRQNEMIDTFLTPLDATHDEEADKKHRLAVRLH